MTSIIELSAAEARKALMASSSFSRLPMPPYFDFTELLNKTSDAMGSTGGERKHYQSGNPRIRDLETANYRLVSNKGSDLSWRQFDLIHPVLYVELVNLITDPSNWGCILSCFRDFMKIPKIRCCSIPQVENSPKAATESSIFDYWSRFEQESIAKSLEYKYISVTDIANCYGSIYTHTIPWALHGKTLSKHNRGRNKTKLFGDQIDNVFQDMQYGQTNGIPQGNVISDLIAETILGYADMLFTQKIDDVASTAGQSEIDFEILRYRDDYRIFTNSMEDARKLLLTLTQVLQSLNMRLNQSKTLISDDIISTSIKKDKSSLIKLGFPEVFPKGRPQKRLLSIRQFALEYPNSGGLVRLLADFRKSLSRSPDTTLTHVDIGTLIAIIVSIMLKNPRTYPQCMGILSHLFCLLDAGDIESQVELIKRRMSEVPNTGYFDLWLQRALEPLELHPEYQESLCHHVSHRSRKEEHRLWDSSWLIPALSNTIRDTPIVESSTLASLSPVIPMNETELFIDQY